MTCQVRQGTTCTCRPSNPLPTNIVKDATSFLFLLLHYSSSFSSLLLVLFLLHTWRSGLLDPETSFLAWDRTWVCRRFSSSATTLLLVLFLQIISYLRGCFWIPSLDSVTSLRQWRHSLIWFNRAIMRMMPR